MANQYYDTEKLKDLANVADFEGFTVLTKDSYSDEEVHKTLIKKKALKPLMYCAMQTAIVGYGNKTFGEFKLGEDTVDVKALYREFGVKDELGQSEKLLPGDLTPRRLQRFFRQHIRKFLDENPDVSPYLWKKYSTRDLQFRTVTFPGAESLVKSKESARYIMQTYRELDARMGTNISERIMRVFTARKILGPEDN